LNELVINGYSNGKNGTNLIEELANLKDPNKIVKTVTKVLQGFDPTGNGMETKELIDQMNEYMATANDDIAKAMAILGRLANVSMSYTATFNSILSILDDSLKGSLSYSLDGHGKSVIAPPFSPSLYGKNLHLANVFGVIFGTIKGPQVNLMSAKCMARVLGNVIYVQGDIRSAK
ncbi:hypothetical protein PMAYCL1PPCAC_28456, partial [Pristionchus mayeri]